MKGKRLCLGLASLRPPSNIKHGVEKVAAAISEGADKACDIICFPETYIPGLRGSSHKLPPPDQRAQEEALKDIRKASAAAGIAVIVGMEWLTEGDWKTGRSLFQHRVEC